MSANVGLTTPRGSGTSGYVQRNLSHIKPRDNDNRTGQPTRDSDQPSHTQRQPDPAILEHERKRRIEVQIFELRDKLEEEGLDEDEIDERADKLREQLEKDGASKVDVRGLKSHQVHDLAKAKIEETERVRRALGINKDYEEGGHWKKQEERKIAAARTLEELEEPEDRDSEVERKQDRQRKRRSYRDRDAERYEDRRSRTRSPDS